MLLHSATNFSVFLFWDRALDVAKSNLDAYLEERDPKHLRWKPGELPMEFVCRPIDNEVATYHLGTAVALPVQRRLAFMASVVEVRNCDGRLNDRASRPGGFIPPRVASAGNLDALPDPWLLTREDMRLFDVATQQEVGEVCLRRAFLPLDVVGGFLLPHTSQRLLAVMHDLYAAQAQTSPSQDGMSNSSPAKEATPSGDESDVPGDATAME